MFYANLIPDPIVFSYYYFHIASFLNFNLFLGAVFCFGSCLNSVLDMEGYE